MLVLVIKVRLILSDAYVNVGIFVEVCTGFIILLAIDIHHAVFCTFKGRLFVGKVLYFSTFCVFRLLNIGTVLER